MIFARVTVVAIAGSILPFTLAAQRGPARRPIELGIDAALIHESSDNITATRIELPVSRFRVGFFLSDAVSFEPSLSLQYARVTIENPLTGRDNTSSGTSYDMDFGLLYHFSTQRTQTQTFVRPFVGIRGFSGEGEHGSQATFGAALGFKQPLSNRLAARFEVGFAHRAEDEPTFPSTNVLFFALGLSFFTH
jgi:hypothetical protein